MEKWNYKDNKDYLAKLEQNYGNFFVNLPPTEENYDLAIKLAFFNVRARLDVYRDWDFMFGSGERAYPDFLKLDGFLSYLFIPPINTFWHYKWLVRNSKTFYYNYQRFDEFLMHFEFCNFIETWLIQHSNKEKFPLLDKDVETLRNDLSLVSRAATLKGQELRNQFPIVEEFENEEFRFASDEDSLRWSFESYAFRYRNYVQNLSFDFKGRRNLPVTYYVDLMLSFRISLKLLYESEQVFGTQQDLFFILQYYFVSSSNDPLLTVLQIRYFYDYFFEKNRETIFKDLLVYWFGKPIKKNSKYGHVFYLVRHKEKQFLYYISLTINFTDKNFSKNNLTFNFEDQRVQSELEDKLILQHYTLTVDTSHFDDSLKIPQLAKLDLKLDYFSPNLLTNEFEKKFLFKFYTKDKILFESAEFLDLPTRNETSFISSKFSSTRVELLLPNLFEDSDPSFKETIHKPTYYEIERFSDRYSKTKDGVAFLIK